MATAWFYQYCWGFSSVPAETTDRDEEMRRYSQALCNVIGADGTSSKAEIAWVQGYFANKGYGNLVDEVEKMAKAAEGKTLEEVTAETKEALNVGTLRFAANAIIYDSIRAAMADGLDDKEFKATITIGKAFGLSAEKVEEIKELVLEEEALKPKKARLVTPGHPCLDEKYQ